MAELVDAFALKADGFGCAGSIPAWSTMKNKKGFPCPKHGAHSYKCKDCIESLEELNKEKFWTPYQIFRTIIGLIAFIIVSPLMFLQLYLVTKAQEKFENTKPD